MLKEMKVIWDKFQDQSLGLEGVTKEEVLALKTALEKVDVKKLTAEEQEVQELLQGANLENHKSVVGGLYNLFLYA